MVSCRRASTNDPIEFGVRFKNELLPPSGEVVIWEANSREYGTRSLRQDRLNLGEYLRSDGRLEDRPWLAGISEKLDKTYLSHAEGYGKLQGRLSGVWDPAKREVGAQLRGSGEANISLVRMDANYGSLGNVQFAIGSSAAFAVDAGAYSRQGELRGRALVSMSASLLSAKSSYNNGWSGRWGEASLELDGRFRFVSIGGAAGYEMRLGERSRWKPVVDSGQLIGGSLNPSLEVKPNWHMIWSDVNYIHTYLIP